ncbi:hypothetical protein Esti_003370 [Eimeria stiedai]
MPFAVLFASAAAAAAAGAEVVQCVRESFRASEPLWSVGGSSSSIGVHSKSSGNSSSRSISGNALPRPIANGSSSSSSSSSSSTMLRRLLRPVSLRWRRSRSLGLVLATAGCFSWVAATKFREAVRVTGNASDVRAPIKLFCLRLVFGRARSRLVGRVMACRIPLYLRPLLASVFLHFQPSAAADSRYPLEAYDSLGQLFCRRLKDGAREIEDLAPFAMVREGFGA